MTGHNGLRLGMIDGLRTVPPTKSLRVGWLLPPAVLGTAALASTSLLSMMCFRQQGDQPPARDYETLERAWIVGHAQCAIIEVSYDRSTRQERHLQKLLRIELLAECDEAEAATLHQHDVRHVAPAHRQGVSARLRNAPGKRRHEDRCRGTNRTSISQARRGQMHCWAKRSRGMTTIALWRYR